VTYYDARIKCGEISGEAHGLSVLVEASRALQRLIDEGNAKLVGQCTICDESNTSHAVLWHDWEIMVSDFLRNFSSMDWNWKFSDKEITRLEAEELLGNSEILQISLDEI